MIDRILAEIDNEISRLQQVRSLLAPGARGGTKPSTTKVKRKRPPLSAAARKRIAEAQKARWAKQKAAKKS